MYMNFSENFNRINKIRKIGKGRTILGQNAAFSIMGLQPARPVPTGAVVRGGVLPAGAPVEEPGNRWPCELEHGGRKVPGNF
jgi:hypothetical protein